MIKNKKIETWKFEETLPSSLYHLTSKLSSIFPLTSSFFLLNEELVKILVTRCKKINDESDGK